MVLKLLGCQDPLDNLTGGVGHIPLKNSLRCACFRRFKDLQKSIHRLSHGLLGITVFDYVVNLWMRHKSHSTHILESYSWKCYLLFQIDYNFHCTFHSDFQSYSCEARNLCAFIQVLYVTSFRSLDWITILLSLWQKPISLTRSNFLR